jgi:hypothetical protein
MHRMFPLLVVACLSAHLAGAYAVDAETSDNREAAPIGSACAGVTNEGTRKRELMREMAGYIGETLPDDLKRRAQKFFDQVAKLKADCERERSKGGTTR